MFIEKLIFMIVIVIALYLSINVIQNFSIKFDLLNQILEEYNIGYIEDIKIFNLNKCPEFYEEIDKNFKWPGSSKGCGCKNNKNSNNNDNNDIKKFNFNYGNCPSNSNCISIKETSKYDMKKWRNNTICVKRSNNSYLDYEKIYNLEYSNNQTNQDININLPCSNATHKNCGIIDGNLNYFCAKRNQECPINDIRILNENDIGNYSISINKNSNNQTKIISLNNRYNNYSLIKLSDNTVLIFTNEEIKINEKNYDMKIIPINFRIEISEKICLSTFKNPKDSLFFPLIKNKFNYICDLFTNKTEIYDENVNIIDSYKLERFYDENNFLIQFKNTFSQFDSSYTQKNIRLFSRNYIGWNYKCLKSPSLSVKKFILIEENLNNILIVNILHSFISISFIIILGIFACFFSKYFEILFKIMNLVFCIFNLIFPIQILSSSNWIINLFTDEDGRFCGDKTFNYILKEISDSCLNMQNSYIWILMITIFYTFFFIYMLYNWIKPLHQNYHDKNKNYLKV
jgi:hypothetical protein